MWSNALRLINVVTAALLATNYFESLARWLESIMPSYTYYCDFFALWCLFCLFMLALRALTDWVSRVQVRFLKIADRIGGTFFSLWVGWALVCFMMMTLHTTPLAPHFLFDGFQQEQHMIMGLAPDRQWLGFMQRMSLGTFRSSATAEESQQQKYVFDPNADFMLKYAARRKNLEEYIRNYQSTVVE